MKKFFIVALMIPLFFSCKKDEVVISDSTELQQQSAWDTEKFKTDYTIQFPGYYTGGYVQEIEGGRFDKARDDSRAHFVYNFFHSPQRFDFGDTLENISDTSIWVTYGDPTFLLDHRIDFTDHESLVGILFYNEAWSIRSGELYWKDGGVFRDALSLHYATDLQDEMVSIIKTIQHN